MTVAIVLLTLMEISRAWHVYMSMQHVLKLAWVRYQCLDIPCSGSRDDEATKFGSSTAKLTYRLDKCLDAFYGVFKVLGRSSKTGVLVVFGPHVQRVVMHMLSDNMYVEGAHLRL